MKIFCKYSVLISIGALALIASSIATANTYIGIKGGYNSMAFPKGMVTNRFYTPDGSYNIDNGK